jgi:hypothetical protein
VVEDVALDVSIQAQIINLITHFEVGFRRSIADNCRPPDNALLYFC